MELPVSTDSAHRGPHNGIASQEPSRPPEPGAASEAGSYASFRPPTPPQTSLAGFSADLPQPHQPLLRIVCDGQQVDVDVGVLLGQVADESLQGIKKPGKEGDVPVSYISSGDGSATNRLGEGNEKESPKARAERQAKRLVHAEGVPFLVGSDLHQLEQDLAVPAAAAPSSPRSSNTNPGRRATSEPRQTRARASWSRDSASYQPTQVTIDAEPTNENAATEAPVSAPSHQEDESTAMDFTELMNEAFMPSSSAAGAPPSHAVLQPSPRKATRTVDVTATACSLQFGGVSLVEPAPQSDVGRFTQLPMPPPLVLTVRQEQTTAKQQPARKPSAAIAGPGSTEEREPPPDHLHELDRIRMCFDMPIQDAAKLLNTGVTVLKRKCRQYNIPRWPYRKLKSIQNLYKSMENLEAQQADSGIDGNSIRETKLKLFVEKESMMWDPAISLNQETKKLRQSNFKYEYKIRQEKGHQAAGEPKNAAAEQFPEEPNSQQGNDGQQQGGKANGMMPTQMASAAAQHRMARGYTTERHRQAAWLQNYTGAVEASMADTSTQQSFPDGNGFAPPRISSTCQ